MEHKLMMKRFWQGYKECSVCEKYPLSKISAASAETCWDVLMWNFRSAPANIVVKKFRIEAIA